MALTKNNLKYERIISTARNGKRLKNTSIKSEKTGKLNKLKIIKQMCRRNNKEQLPIIKRQFFYNNAAKYLFPQTKPRQIKELLHTFINKENGLSSSMTNVEGSI